MSTAFITCHYCKKTGHKGRDCKTKLESEVKMENKKSSIMRDRKSGSDTIKLRVIRISIVSSKCKSRKKNKNERKKKWCSLRNSTSH